MPVIGCDWSAAQGDNIDCPSVKKEGVEFVWLKTSHGTGGDARWLSVVVDHVTDTFELVGAYGWFKPRQDPLLQADNWSKRSEKLILRASTPLPLMFDFEDDDRHHPDGPIRGQMLVDRASTCIERIEKNSGCRVIVYTGKWFMIEAVGTTPCPVLSARDLCHAEYPSTTRSGGEHSAEFVAAMAALPAAHLPPQWKEWRFRQFDGDKGLYLPQGTDSDFDEWAGDLPSLRAWTKAQWSWNPKENVQLGDGRAPNDPYIVDRLEALAPNVVSDTQPAPPEPARDTPDTLPSTPAAKATSSQRLAAVKAPILGVDGADETWDGSKDPPKS